MMSFDTNCDVFVQSTKRIWFTRLFGRGALLNLFLIVYVITALLLNGGFKPIYQRGFFCRDASIHYPVKTDTINFRVLLLVALVFPLIVIFICDIRIRKVAYAYGFAAGRRRKTSDVQADVNANVGSAERKNGETIKRRLVVNDDDDADEEEDLCKICDTSSQDIPVVSVRSTRRNRNDSQKRMFDDRQLYVFGFATTALFTGIGKVVCGRLRPHFMQRCVPNVNCNLPENVYRYIEEFECTGNITSRDVSYITTSWPSGKYRF